MKKFRHHSDELSGFALIAVLAVLALITLLVVALLQSRRIERTSTSIASAQVQSHLATESGIAAACSLLMKASSNRPAFLVGLGGENSKLDIAPCLFIGNTNLTNKTQLLPLFSYDLNETTSFPKLNETNIEILLQKRNSTNPNEVIDLNNPFLIDHQASDTNVISGGLIAQTGHYPALWQPIHNSEKKLVGRFAFILTDESARLNPLLHHGTQRNHPINWDMGPTDLPLTNGSTSLFTPNQSTRLQILATSLPTIGSFESAFDNLQTYEEKKYLITRDPCLQPDLIPAAMPEGGQPKYNLNDLVTNPAWGATPYDRAEKIAEIIDKNLPKFKQRDPSLAGRLSDPKLYLRRLACNIVDYISPDPGPTTSPENDAMGRDLVPLVTQITECCTRTALTSNSTTIESRFFAEVWNPTTSTIPAGGIPRLFIGNRARVKFGTGIEIPFSPYDKMAASLTALHPNEFLVIAFDPVRQTWTSPETTTNPPRWDIGPRGNADSDHQQFFAFLWNGRIVDRSRPPKTLLDKLSGGLNHLAQTLSDNKPHWQCMSIPTRSVNSDSRQEADTTDEAISPGTYRFVGDPNATYLSCYKWGVVTNYTTETRWNGCSPAAVIGSAPIMDPVTTWSRRDHIPVNPVSGNAPVSEMQTPDLIISSYQSERDGASAPFVIRKGPMLSLGELGHINDPAQVDDLLQAPLAGSGPASLFCCGGGRTLRIGQPESSVLNPSATWDAEGKRAIELLDIFTLSDKGHSPEANIISTNPGIPGRLNVNTASHEALTALFSGITVTSDARFTNSTISSTAVDQLATLIEQNRPYSHLSDLRILTTNLCNAESYIPNLSKNILGVFPPVADVFDRAREEAFGKIIGHCTVQSRTFHLFVVGEALNQKGKTISRSVLEAIVHLTPDNTGRLIPSLHDIQWH